MQVVDGDLVVSPTDLVGFLYCEHLTHLSVEAAAGAIATPRVEDPDLVVLSKRGLEHEAAYLAKLEASGRQVVVIGEGDLGVQVAETNTALQSGADAIYQGAFYEPGRPAWRGYADFLIRVEGASGLGAFLYEPEDTKLARRVRPSAVLQLCHYAEQLAAVQGVAPEWMHVVLGGGVGRVSLRLADFDAYYRAAKRRFLAALVSEGRASPTYPLPVAHCHICSWRETCDARRTADDHLSLVAGLGRDQARKLNAGPGITTVTELAASSDQLVPGIGQATFSRLRDQARLQVVARTDGGPPPWELLECPGPGIGLGALPLPSPGDLFFDIEGDPFVGIAGLEYLLGLSWTGDDGAPAYKEIWAHNPDKEKLALEELVDFVVERRARFPDMHVYHYAPYEPAALGRLMGRHATREEEIDSFLRGELLVDLYQVIRQGIRIGSPSYSLKKLESLYMDARTETITDAGSSIVEYERWLEDGDDQILADIRDYNRVDCESTARLRDWLEDRRTDYATAFDADPPRPLIQKSEASAGHHEESAGTAELLTCGCRKRVRGVR